MERRHHPRGDDILQLRCSIIVKQLEMTPVLQQFMKEIQEVHGAMIDVCSGFRALRDEIDKLAAKTKLPPHGTISTGSWDPGHSNVIDSVSVGELR